MSVGAAVASPTAAAVRPVRRSLWWTIHHWLGLKLSLLTAVVMLSGTVAVFSYEIDWLIFPAMRVQPQDRPYASWGAWRRRCAVTTPRRRSSAWRGRSTRGSRRAP